MGSHFTESKRKGRAFGHLFGCLTILLIAQTSAAQEVVLNPTYSGESIALRMNVIGAKPLTLDDSGSVPVNGGVSQNSLWDASPFGVNGRGFYAMSDGTQGVNHSASSATLLDITVGGHRIVTQYLTVDAFAKSAFLGVTTSGKVGNVQLALDGQTVAVTGQPNQKIELSDGYLLINEQTVSGDGRNSASITVNGLHLVVNRKADVIVCSSWAGVTKPSP
jgi:hypothetical protein